MTAPGQHHLAELAHTVVSTASSGTSFTDYLTGWGTIALAVATFTAVIVSLRQASADRRRSAAERDRHWQTQARLVLTDMVLIQAYSARPSRDIVFGLRNSGEQPVIDVHAEAWEKATGLDQTPTWQDNARVVLPGDERRWALEVPGRQDSPALVLWAWRYRWTDADGRKWCVDQPQQPEPLPFTGQQPRPY